jgi:hypothetical protein
MPHTKITAGVTSAGGRKYHLGANMTTLAQSRPPIAGVRSMAQTTRTRDCKNIIPREPPS